MSFIGIGSPIPEIANLPGQGGAIEVLLDYSSSAVCNDEATQSPSQAEPAGGVFSASPSGLNINTSDGVITPTGSTPNTYTITYTVSGESSSFTFTINPLQQSTFSYSSSSLEQYGTASPIFASGTTTGGTFSATSGLVINTTTGVLDLANSTIGGPYTVTYTTPGPCATSSTFNVSVTALSTSLVDNNFAIEFNGVDTELNTNATLSELGFPATTTSSGSFSVSFWYNATTHVNYAPVIWSSTNYNLNDGFGVSQQLNTTQLRFWVGRFSFNAALTSNLDTSRWYHIVCVFTGGSTYSLQTYVDGVAGSTVTGTTSYNINNSGNPVHIGSSGGAHVVSYPFNGDIDEVAIWNRALPSGDIQRIYNGSSTSGKAANLFSTGLSNGLVYWNRMGD
tara:strand:- start:277 stop:1458 length:1182 start_codon:yes stop_codon:yes gene_type:complete